MRRISLPVILLLCCGGCALQETRPVPLLFSLQRIYTPPDGSPVYGVFRNEHGVTVAGSDWIAALRSSGAAVTRLSAPVTAAAARQGVVAVFLKDRRALLLESRTGRVLGRCRTEGWVALQPLPGKVTLFADHRHRLWRWRPPAEPELLLQCDAPVTVPPVLFDGKILIGTYNKKITVLDAVTGRLIRRITLPAGPDAMLHRTPGGGLLFFGRDRVCYLLSPETGHLQRLWRAASWCDAVAGAGREFYFRSRGDCSGMVDAARGLVWVRSAAERVFVPVPAGIWAAAVTAGGRVEVLYRATGTLSGVLQSGLTVTGQPVADGRGVLIPAQDGLYRLRWQIAPGS